ncbi:uncharacterized protein EI90DRAFT_3129489 [Cantharellus anzutake]|uniref:uncharacterized protein n=1 Tax=Cantharellus anzutake TaxID=1750568 RepID=UPI001906A563|nr:uncharacterized protein EI90DRAFT_3129489 [Cantharellus anzutake]KAF8324751.1 hypothetical protein EI90DRAFT_3129489 [Cantharellus anzutake]
MPKSKMCFCTKCGNEGQVLHIKTWNDHQNAQKRHTSYQRYASDVLRVPVSASPISATGSDIDNAGQIFDNSESGSFPQQPNPIGSCPEPDVFLAPPLPGFINECNNDSPPHSNTIQPSDEASAEEETGSQPSSDEESNSSNIPFNSGSAPLDDSTALPAAPSSTFPSIPLIHCVSQSGGVDENSPDPFLSHTDTQP